MTLFYSFSLFLIVHFFVHQNNIVSSGAATTVSSNELLSSRSFDEETNRGDQTVEEQQEEHEIGEQREEQFSRLNFNVDDVVDTMQINMRHVEKKKDFEIEEERLNNSFWGRLYMDGFPGQNGAQYFRAHFGQRPPSKHIMFVLADPLDGCSNSSNESGETINNRALNQTLTSSPSLYANETVIVAMRGNCSFAQKAQIAHDKGAAGILFINNEEGNMFPSASGSASASASTPTQHGSSNMRDVNLSVTMIGKHHGERLLQALQKLQERNYGKLNPNPAAITGKFVPIYCDTDNNDSNNYCSPVMGQDSLYVDKFFTRPFTGTMVVSYSSFSSSSSSSDNESETCNVATMTAQNENENENKYYHGAEGEGYNHYKFNYVQAEFGLRIEHGESFPIVQQSLSNDMDFCNEVDLGLDTSMDMDTDMDMGNDIGDGDKRTTSYTAKAVLVHRGNCSFATKAKNVASTGAKMMIVVNGDGYFNRYGYDDDDSGLGSVSRIDGGIIPMGVDNDYEGSKIHIAAIMISRDGWEEFKFKLKFRGCNVSTSNVTLHPNPKTT